MSGPIPPGLASLSELWHLLLGGNQLTGEIPAWLGDLPDLYYLDLSRNRLTGEIPVKLGSRNRLGRLFLGGNLLTGCIPHDLRGTSDVFLDNEPDNDLYELGLPFCDVLLSGIAISSGELTPPFDPFHSEYSAAVGPPEAHMILTNEYGATIYHVDQHGDATAGALGTLEHAVALDADATTIEIEVISADERATHTYTIDLIWTGAPGAPRIVDVTPGGGHLAVSWTAPTQPGVADITTYDLRYIESESADKSAASWTVVKDLWAAGAGGDLAYAVTGLYGDTEYDVQVRAVIGGGTGPWSAVATGTPAASSVCVTGGALEESTNPGLVSDCEALLAAGDELAGSAALSWSAGTPIAEWEGVTVSGTPGRVTRLYLRDRGLTGTMAPELGRLTGLERLYLHDNKLAGTIPDLGGLAKLERLWLNRNELSGTIPSGLGALSNLVQLNLHHNGLSGPIPTELSNLTSLEGLWLHANDLSGTIPPELGRLHNLKWLWLYGNQLSGGIPVELRYLYRLVELNLHSNQLTGAVPVGLGRLGNLEELWLQRNRLTGTIPPAFGRLSRLEWLSLYGNQLDGGIPTELGGLSMLKGLYLHHNRLSGEIPSALGELAVLTDLWLNDNELSGPIPPELSNLAKLERVRMRDNAFTGCIPEGLAAVPDSDLDSLGLGVCDAS